MMEENKMIQSSKFANANSRRKLCCSVLFVPEPICRLSFGIRHNGPREGSFVYDGAEMPEDPLGNRGNLLFYIFVLFDEGEAAAADK